MQNWKLFPLLACAGCYGQTMSPGPATVIRDDGVVTLERALTHESDLWVVPADLPRVNGFELKPEGACLDTLCVPASRDGPDPLLLSRDGSQWFAVTGLARRLAQAVVAVPERRVWSLGPIALARRAYFDSAIAPDFELPNRDGELVRLSDFRGKKVLLVTWASW